MPHCGAVNPTWLMTVLAGILICQPDGGASTKHASLKAHTVLLKS